MKIEKCNECGSKDFEIRRTAVKTATYENSKKVSELKTYRLAEVDFICLKCGNEYTI